MDVHDRGDEGARPGSPGGPDEVSTSANTKKKNRRQRTCLGRQRLRQAVSLKGDGHRTNESLPQRRNIFGYDHLVCMGLTFLNRVRSLTVFRGKFSVMANINPHLFRGRNLLGLLGTARRPMNKTNLKKVSLKLRQPFFKDSHH